MALLSRRGHNFKGQAYSAVRRAFTSSNSPPPPDKGGGGVGGVVARKRAYDQFQCESVVFLSGDRQAGTSYTASVLKLP